MHIHRKSVGGMVLPTQDLARCGVTFLGGVRLGMHIKFQLTCRTKSNQCMPPPSLSAGGQNTLIVSTFPFVDFLSWWWSLTTFLATARWHLLTMANILIVKLKVVSSWLRFCECKSKLLFLMRLARNEAQFIIAGGEVEIHFLLAYLYGYNAPPTLW